MDTKFNTLQLGWDIKPWEADARIGAALSYTSGDTETARRLV